MAKEIERKFLVDSTAYRTEASAAKHIRQGYLCRYAAEADIRATVRVRITDHTHARLTIKSPNCGDVRSEWEYDIPVAEAEDMLAELCDPTRIIDKTRYIVEAAGGLRWEVDEFHGRLEGLTVAEIELPDSDAPLPSPLPPFIGREVTSDPQYYNSNL